MHPGPGGLDAARYLDALVGFCCPCCWVNPRLTRGSRPTAELLRGRHGAEAHPQACPGTSQSVPSVGGGRPHSPGSHPLRCHPYPHPRPLRTGLLLPGRLPALGTVVQLQPGPPALKSPWGRANGSLSRERQTAAALCSGTSRYRRGVMRPPRTRLGGRPEPCSQAQVSSAQVAQGF